MEDKSNRIPFQILNHKYHTAMRPAQEEARRTSNTDSEFWEQFPWSNR